MIHGSHPAALTQAGSAVADRSASPGNIAQAYTQGVEVALRLRSGTAFSLRPATP